MTRDIQVITITLPLPPKSLSPNARVHWARKAKDTRKCREVAACRTIEALRGSRLEWDTATLQATFYHYQNRRRDDDNLIASLKAYRDGLVDGGLLNDDVGVTTLPVVKHIHRDRPRCELTITKE